MNIKHRLIIMNFFQFFLWGSWLITLGAYMAVTLKFTGVEIGAVYGTMGIASLFMPGIAGIIADRWLNAEKVYGLLHIGGAIMLFVSTFVTDPNMMFWVMLLNCMFYMPTISMANTVSYSIMESNGYNIIKDFPPIRVWGTIGFIIAMWTVSLSHLELSKLQLFIASAASLLLGIYSFTLPACPPEGKNVGGSFFSALGLDALILFKKTKMAFFFLFSTALGVCLQITNSFADGYIHSFAQNPAFKDALAVKFPAIIISISQMSETVFILTIPFFLRKFGIKTVMVLSMFAWVLRFALLGAGDPGSGLWIFIISMIVYGMAFDFFNISGSLFVEQEASPGIRASAQGLFMIMTNGIGGFAGSLGAGKIIDMYTTVDASGAKFTDWPMCWYIFAAYALVLALLFIPLFKYKHDPAALSQVKGH